MTNLKIAVDDRTESTLRAGEGGLPHDCVALCHQVQARGKASLTAKLGELSAERLAEVQDCLLNTMGL